MSKRLTLIIGIVLAVLAVVLINVYLSNRERQIQQRMKQELAQWQKNQTAVLVAKSDIPRGSIINSELLETKIVPNQYIQPRAATSLDRISGMVVAVPIAKGEQITLSKLITSSQAQAHSLAMATPVGKRAITVSVDNIAALGGMIKPGDYVDVIALVPLPAQTQEGKQTIQVATISLFQNVLVLAVGQKLTAYRGISSRYKKGEEKMAVSPLITLALGPLEANLIAFVQEQGKIRLVLRSPADSQIQPVTPAGWETLFQYVMPQPPPIIKEEAPKRQVEIYRGLKKEVITLPESK